MLTNVSRLASGGSLDLSEMLEVVDLRLTKRNCSCSCWNCSLLSSKNCYRSVLVTHSGALCSRVRNAE